MKVILTEQVANIGQRGEMIEVADGYARNFLIPRKLALMATPENMKKLEENKKIQIKQYEKQIQEVSKLAERIERISCTIPVKVGETEKLFGSVTAQDIVDALANEGINIDKKLVELEEPIKELGIYNVPIKLGESIAPHLKVWVVKE